VRIATSNVNSIMQRVPRLLPWLDQRQPDIVCGCGGGDIYVTREHPRFGWRPSANLGCSVNSPAEEAGPVRVGHDGAYRAARSSKIRVTTIASTGSTRAAATDSSSGQPAASIRAPAAAASYGV
jgi:hypothetical protein